MKNEIETVEMVKARLNGEPIVDKYVVLLATAKMPASCWGRYGKVAVIETDRIHRPTRIAPKDKAVVSIKFLRDRLHIGKTHRSTFQSAVAQAHALAAELNAAYAAENAK